MFALLLLGAITNALCLVVIGHGIATDEKLTRILAILERR